MTPRLPLLALITTICACSSLPDLRSGDPLGEDDGVDQDPKDSGWNAFFFFTSL